MTFQISPGVAVTETDNTAVTTAVKSSAAAFAGVFRWGPVLYPITINSEAQLLTQFFKPNNIDTVTQDYHTAANFLAYADNLLNVRLDKAGNRNAVSKMIIATDDTVKFTVTGGTEQTFTVTTEITADEIAASINADAALSLLVTASVVKGKLVLTSVDTSKGVIGDYHSNGVKTNAGVITLPIGSTAGKVTILAGSSIKINNDDDYNDHYIDGTANVGEFVAKYPGALGNSLGVILVDNNTFDFSTLTGTISASTSSRTVTGTGTLFTTELFAGYILKTSAGSVIGTVSSIESNTSLTLVDASLTAVTNGANAKLVLSSNYTSIVKKPTTSAFAKTRNVVNALDEVHVLVIDKDGTFTGVPGAILEKYLYASKAADARTENGTSNYYKNVVNNSSNYVRWTDHPTQVSATGSDWGSRLEDLTADAVFKSLNAPLNVQFVGGVDDFDVNDSDKLDAYAMLSNKEQYKFTYLITGKSNVVQANYAIQSVAEVRKDCVAFISPVDAITDALIIGNTSASIDKIKEFRNGLPSSSWGHLDTGFKYQYDRFNDKFIWVPLNGDIAGIYATLSDPWISGGGFNRGQIKNAIKLSVNPNKADRDALYISGINPVVSFKGQGVVLYGDKTLLDKPSAFDRISTRFLFIFLEASIEKTSQYQLFEINDEFTRTQFRNAVEPFLKDIKGRRGIFDFKVVCDSTNNSSGSISTNNLNADIYIKPQYGINFINLNFIGTNQSASFSVSGG